MPRRTDIESILVIGSGPIVIGQACEFDYSGTQACRVLGSEGYRVILANSNPATIMTDPEVADRTYIEPLVPEVLREIIRRERPDAVLPTLGGQTALNLAMELTESGTLDELRVQLIGANADVDPYCRGPRSVQGGDGGDRPRGAGFGLRQDSRRGGRHRRIDRVSDHDPPELHPRGGRYGYRV